MFAPKIATYQASARLGSLEGYSQALRVSDSTALALSGLAVFLIRQPSDAFEPYGMVIALAVLAWLAVAGPLDLYRRPAHQGLSDQIGGIVAGLVIIFAGLSALGYGAKIASEFSRLWALGWFASALATMTGARALIARRLAQDFAAGHLATRVFVVAASAGDGDAIIRDAGQGDRRVARLLGVLVPSEGGDLGVLAALVAARQIDDILLVGDLASLGGADGVTRLGALAPARVLLALDPVLSQVPVKGLPQIFGRACSVLVDAPLSGHARLVKDIEDLVLGVPLALAALPIVALAALAIRLESRGPIFFRQSRRGFRGEVFEVWKLRTMAAEVGLSGDDSPARRQDPRVTRIGRVLRRFSIDELPQLFNVLKRDMSLVGPRPHALAHDDAFSKLIADYALRRHFLPGMTGLAQVKGFRGAPADHAALEARVRHDLAYIETWSLGLDLSILVETLLAIWNDQNAY